MGYTSPLPSTSAFILFSLTMSTTTVRNAWTARHFNQMKTSKDGKRYTGMRIGGKHKWSYAPSAFQFTNSGQKQTERAQNVTEVDFEYDSVKTRARKAPTGSGAAIGSRCVSFFCHLSLVV